MVLFAAVYETLITSIGYETIKHVTHLLVSINVEIITNKIAQPKFYNEGET